MVFDTAPLDQQAIDVGRLNYPVQRQPEASLGCEEVWASLGYCGLKPGRIGYADLCDLNDMSHFSSGQALALPCSASMVRVSPVAAIVRVASTVA